MIRRLQDSDIEMVREIFREVMEVSEAPLGPVWSSEQIEHECRKGGWCAISVGNEIEAFVLMREMGGEPPVGEITFLATKPAIRKKGVMKSLLRHVLAGRAVNAETWLEVHERNVPARRLYESFGFRQVGVRPQYYSDGGTACLYSHIKEMSKGS